MSVPALYVYILSDHGEDGAENVCATLDRNLLIGMVERNWPTDSFISATIEEMSDWQKDAAEKRRQEWIARGVVGLKRILEASDEELANQISGHNCHAGWGGMQLHVVKLTA